MGKEQMIREIGEMLEKLCYRDVRFLHGMIQKLIDKQKKG